ncbi:hybrid sensor histidine kinase/response regulator [Piscinibacter terrae]|nr:PAS domain-containing hybrid sensor histidine kinase/response regulator [Albitalea terrae]
MPSSPSSMPSSWQRIARWVQHVDSLDPVRRALNAGLAWVLLAMAVLGLTMGGVLIWVGRPALPVCVALAIAPLCMVCWWLNRGGSALGAAGFVVLLIVATTLGIDPHLYAGPVPVVDVAFMISVVAAALFVRPSAGLVALVLQLLALAVALHQSDIPSAQAAHFLAEAAVEMGAIAALLVVAARIFIRTLEKAQQRAKALAQSEERERRLVQANVVGILISDSLGRVTLANDAFLTMLGFDQADFNAGLVQPTTFVPRDQWMRFETALMDMKRHGRSTYETDLLHKDGTSVPVLVSSVWFADREESVAFVLDHTEHRRHERERRAREAAELANASKTTFLANMSHELRTPLNAILGFAQLLEHESTISGNRAPNQARYASLIRDSGEHLLALIEDVLDIARVEAGRLELFPAAMSLREFLDGVSSTAALRCSSKRIGFVYEPSSDLPEGIVADAKRLRQTLLNLLDNAAKFTEAGQVTLRATLLKSDNTSACLRFEVLDTGPGIAREDLDRIFQPFEQVGELRLRRGGAGLGLAICRQLVRLMGGEVRVISHPGKGSRFWFDLDVPLAVLRPPTSNRLMPSGYEGELRSVLVADDVALNRTLLHSVLTPLGFEVHDATDGEQALRQAMRLKPDLIVIDSVMPVLDGVEAIRQIRAAPDLARTPIISISASAMASDRERCLQAGADMFVPKPIDIPQLLDAIERTLKVSWTYPAD